MSDILYDQLSGSIRRIEKTAGSTLVSRALLGNLNSLSENLRMDVMDGVPAYRETRNPNIQAEMSQHLKDHLEEICRLLDERNVQEMVFVKEHAQSCAKQYFPLEAVLHTYRCCLKIVSTQIQYTYGSANLTDLVLDYFNVVSTLFTEHYLEQIRLASDEFTVRNSALLSLLLHGYDEADGRISKILQNSGYIDNRLTHCVAVAQSVDSSEMFHPARARRLLAAIDVILKPSPVIHLIDLYQNQVVIVFSHKRRTSGWTAPHSKLAVRLKSELRNVGNAALIGVSNDVSYLSLIPAAYKEAQLALDMATVSRRVVQISEIPLQELLVHLAAEQLTHVLPDWYEGFIQSDEQLNGVLIKTIRAYAQSNMNALKTAVVLDVHPNTVYARMRKIQNITGLDIKSYSDMNELSIIAQYHKKTLIGE